MNIVEGWLDSAIRCPSPNYNQRPEAEPPSLLVIHNISLPPGRYGGGYIEAFFLNKLDSAQDPYFEQIQDLQVSAHFLIAREGKITQFVSCLDRAWHAGASNFCGRENCNDYSIGIELEGQDFEAYTSAQYDALKELAGAIIKAYPKINTDSIVGHCDIAPERKTDPGPSFDWDRFKASI
ncbi:N-acetyl-anhydromuranmyl-L-alanine amidase [Oleiphilus sp. HI0071]|jgi:AmpD protein|uniref:1,6-anhydro-N-acetylmuramyl-L-alanine amidase AmpD n=1 Tax=unclassified Oleiphilus TaxID=2631174 RepID=UPI0007C35CB8|nr:MULTISPECIES: 1,6-anhydro-N-acetylmuramyl-L-alanine amidase AmpD [unclassified Oleiphilus]KZY70134.1 N-acetyl-anhydromuranmyl-L-alanine amidase [Oleiphilus sp. HI0065]KZY83398.1 N-acetyl-anhydromuranmyl-L-alanine amidase [Oleiphilus sp. HI0071]KZY91068.1 N-acetyl-anhydromuranmyl-L-alanine amidase [Oleiphilus sp. HI0073]KZZ42091.1 N-acetyl-anhydromuranmyl-L-alanine amidase [Oleiphilus sp. HI0118]KZZ60461.1 N-acetyl-anhydromuranmyl-L-alanine amidase [Oleiphilus sp. HI0122]KZZ64685.1 N-acetyl